MTVKKDGSSSISNQRKLLIDFANKNEFKNIKVSTDDRVSEVTFDRGEFKKLLKLIKQKAVSTLIVKNMSRLKEAI